MSVSEKIDFHFHTLLELLKIERAEDLRQYQLKIANRSFQERKKEGVTWYPVAVVEQKYTVGEKIEITIERTSDFQQRHLFQSGSSISLFSNANNEEEKVGAVISYIRENQAKIIINSNNVPDWLRDGRLGIDLMFDESTYREMEGCVRFLLKANRGRVAELKDIFIGENLPQSGKPSKITIPSLNQSQNEALNHVISTKDVGAIHGPPGTGKTTTLVKTIKVVAEQEGQVLICAPSNVAIDILVEKLALENVDVLRLGHPARVIPTVLNNTLDAKSMHHPDFKSIKDLRKKAVELRKLGEKYKRNFGAAERAQRKQIFDEAKRLRYEARQLEDYVVQSIVDRSQVIACTLTGTNHRLLKERYFRTVFIDEAGQALEPACWMAITKAERVIMAGDYQQLPPTVKSNEAMRRGLSKTLFERMVNDKNLGVMLREQYRMHESIMAFSSDYFYKGELQAADVVKQRISFFEGTEVEFIDTAGCGFTEKVNEQTLSTYNTEEAQLLLKHLSSLNPTETEGMSIGIVAPYKAQVNTIKEEIKNFDVPESQIVVHSVDGFQGQEKDIIYISLVRSNDKAEIGFLKDIRRMNVAITRARYKLVVVGDSATLSANGFYNALIDFFQQRNWYKSAFEILY